MANKPYMPLMMGDWVKGTRGMRADVKGVYIGLLIHQYDTGYIPKDIEELSLIEPEVRKVWDKLKDKFEEFEPGRLRNKKCEEVRAFWSKQRSNGTKGGRPKAKQKPNNNPNTNPKPNHHIDLDIDLDIDLKNKKESEKIDFTKPDVDGDEVMFPIDTPAMRNLWSSWKEARWNNFGVRYAMHGEQAALRQLANMNFHEIEQAIQQAIASNWKNLYPEKNGKRKGTNKEQQTASTIEYLANHYGNKSK